MDDALRGPKTVYYHGAILALHVVDGVVQHAEISGVLDSLPDEVRDDDGDGDPIACPEPLGRALSDAIEASLPAVVNRGLTDGITVFAGGGPRSGSEPFTVHAG